MGEFYKANELLEFFECDESFSNEVRICDECGKAMQAGYYVFDEYYCGEDCLHKHMSEVEFLMYYNDMDEEDCIEYCKENGEDWTCMTAGEKEAVMQRYDDETNSMRSSDDAYYTEWFDSYFMMFLTYDMNAIGIDWNTETPVNVPLLNDIWFIRDGYVDQFLKIRDGLDTKVISYEPKTCSMTAVHKGKQGGKVTGFNFRDKLESAVCFLNITCQD